MTRALFLCALLGAGCQAGDPAPAATAVSPSDATADTLDAAFVRDCTGGAVPTDGTPVHVVGRRAADGAEVVRIVWFGPGDALRPPTSDLYLRDGSCEAIGRESDRAVWSALRSLSRSPEVHDRIVALQVEAAGGPEALRDSITSARETIVPIHECEPGELRAEDLCSPPEAAEAYRRAGFDVPRPRRSAGDPSWSRADLGSVPDSLKGCVPLALRQDGESDPAIVGPNDGFVGADVEFIGAVEAGTRQLLLFNAYPRGWVTYEGEYHVGIAARYPDGVCESVYDWTDGSLPSDRRLNQIGAVLGSEAVERRWAEVEVERAGGPERYVDLYREQTLTEGPHACPQTLATDADERLCVDGPRLEALRDLGVDVRPPTR